MADIRFEHVSKRYPGKGEEPAVRDLSYTIRSGHFVSLLGPSGCGKSTTLNMIAGLEGVTEGEISIGGRPVHDVEPHQRDLAFVFQDYALYPHLDVYGNIAFGLRMRKMDRAEIDARVTDAAERLEITAQLRKKPRSLSGGQRQRVALARAIARRPAVLLFDEPLSNLDALLRDRTREELKVLHAEVGATTVYVTHDQEEAMSLSDEIAVMSRGRLEQYGTPSEIYQRPATEFVASFVGKPQMNLLTVRTTHEGLHLAEGWQLRHDHDLGEGRVVRLGLRPNECDLLRPEPGAPATGTVRVTEPLGSHTDLVVDTARGAFRVRVSGFTDLRPGDPVRVAAEGALPHLFDVDSGARLG
ncbi:ABC transporter ATP-binding protein [Phycicoccus endophyticus]|uniref:ABC transporter ATP-binding protein n=1 Tax=Phycicoccus endophyticus TaxID=1690220 RepID=A0A7G9QZX4_9MICO|nr:ABC transporter ATP-binding protein [Phycicoccus endophyticus]NHI20753.1 ABC transporter ATP-binding protein [Phycicoccus endophyticus]QNN48899.1 ABC transporter ATP-binding protein [Phycicoccus endophyticus]GGL43657.1 sugar ABC transporter ATP-binding protein [Phycicoccus endophyticus]